MSNQQAMARALLNARRMLWRERTSLWCDFTIPPERSWDHMNDDEKRVVRRFDSRHCEH
jgi:hypothetical protein